MGKKGWFLGLSLFAIFAVAACGSKEKTAIYTLKQDDENVTIKNNYKDDTLLKQTVETVIQYSTMGVKSKTKAEKLLEPSEEIYANKEGIRYSVDFKDKEAIEIVEVDLKKLSQEEAKMLPLFSLPEGSLDSASEKTNEEKLMQLGFKKKK